jgi:uncharacterized repeat protein (TIGR03803 family)
MTNPTRQRGLISLAAGAVLTFVVALALGAAVTTPSAQAQTFTVLYNFTGSPDGAFPLAGLIRDAAGNLYGTTPEGGTSGWGTMFKVDTSGTERVLFNFSYSKGYGASPYGGLVRDAAGNLYGTAGYGGSSGNGLVFKLSNNGKETVLHNFAGGTRDGCSPFTESLVRDSAGNLYGTTSACGALGYGTVFKLDTSGKETVLHNFAGGTRDGCSPQAGMIRDTAGNLYSTTVGCGAHGYGTVWKLNTTGKETVLYSLCSQINCTDGAQTHAGVIRDTKGNLYGTTQFGGITLGGGTVFKLSQTGKLTTLYSFCSQSNCTDGQEPEAGLIRDAAGNLYGTTGGGGVGGSGTVWKLNTTGEETVMYSFCSQSNCSDGAYPLAGLIRDAAGNLYGTAEGGGVGGYGTVWKLTP